MRKKSVFAILSCILFEVSIVLCQPQASTLTIIHTNDLQSRLLPFGPNRDYTPDILNDDHTIGGIARMATLIRSLKQKAPESTLVIDGGDFLMGTLFHTITREEAPELRLLHAIGYDALTLGNHEFDFRPEGLVQTIRTAQRHNALPPLVLANAIFNATDARDDGLQQLFDAGVVRPYRTMVKNGIRIGIFGVLGKDAAEVAPFAAPLQFDDPVAAAKRMVKILKQDEQVDLIICASHGGVWRNAGEEDWAGEDVALAVAVPEIDVIVGGHSHTPLPQPLREGRTLVLQAGSEGRFVGELNLRFTAQGLGMENYLLHAVTDSIAADSTMQAEVQKYVELVNQNVLAETGYAFDQIVAEADFDLTLRENNSNLGNLVSDAVRWSIARAQSLPSTIPMIAVESNGVIRDDLFRGASGLLQVSDVFRAVPLGIGMIDEAPGYPLVSFYLTAEELKRAVEIMTSVYPLKGSSYYLQPAGMRFYFNPYRILFDRVYEIELATADDFLPLQLSSGDRGLYRVGCNIYNATFIKLIGNFTHGFLRMTPKDSSGAPIVDLETALVDARPDLPGVQELKEWHALLDYIHTFRDTDGDGIPNIPERYRNPQARIVRAASFSPHTLYKNATYVMWGATWSVLLLFVFFVNAGFYLVKRHNQR